MRSNEVRGKRGIGVSSGGLLFRACRPSIAFMFVAAPVALLPVSPAAAQPADERVGYAAALVLPDRIEDTPSLKPDLDKFPEVDNFAWRAFVALNWPSLTDPADRGVLD